MKTVTYDPALPYLQSCCLLQDNYDDEDTTWHQTCKTKTKIKNRFFFVSDWHCPKTDGLRPHHCYIVASQKGVLSTTSSLQFNLLEKYIPGRLEAHMVWRPIGSCLISPRVTPVILNKLKAVFGGGLRCPSVFYGESTTTFSKILISKITCAPSFYFSGL